MDVYKQSLVPAYQKLFERFELRDAAIKVVGIGECWNPVLGTVIQCGRKRPIFPSSEKGRESVLEPFAGKSRFANHGERIVYGYRLMQPYSDIFLGWTKGELEGRHFFVRQLSDMKISVRVNTLNEELMKTYARWCGQALALSHARSGDPVVISGYLGKSDVFDEAIADFSFSYANQNEIDFARFRTAIRDGKLER